MRSPEQARYRAIAADIDTATGLRGTAEHAIGDWTDGAENTLVAHFRGINADDLRYAGALKGAVGNQKSVLNFLVDRIGTDHLYTFTIPKVKLGLSALRDSLTRRGIKYRTIIPKRDGFEVLVVDTGTQLRQNIADFGQAHGLTIRSKTGRAEFIGSQLDSPTRADGLRAYRNIIADYERRYPDRGYRLAGGGRRADFGAPPPAVTLPLRERSFIRTVREAHLTAPDVARRIQGYYEPITNKQTLASAQQAVQKNMPGVLREVLDPDSKPTADLTAKGLELMRQFQNARDYESAVKVAETLAERGTEASQNVQAFSMWGRLTPEGMLVFGQRQVRKLAAKQFASNFLRKHLFGKQVKVSLSQDGARQITEITQRAASLPSGVEKDTLVREAMNVVAKEVPLGIGDVLDAYRYTNMLSNLRTFF